MKNQTANQYFRQRFGCKVYRIAIDGGFTCPNRDGRIDTRGCIFCSGYGAGDFAQDKRLGITGQIERGKELVSKKMPDGGKYIAYFQFCISLFKNSQMNIKERSIKSNTMN